MDVEVLMGKAGVDQCRRCLQDFQNTSPDLRYLILTTTDGFEVAASGDISPDDYSRLAAMASSLLSLCQAVVHDTGLPSCEDVLIDGVNGKVLLMAVPGRPPEMVLMAVSYANAPAGRLLLDLRSTAMTIRRELQQLVPRHEAPAAPPLSHAAS